MIIKNAIVYKNGAFKDNIKINVKDDVFCDSGSGEVIDAKGLYLIPGLIDIHTHGSNGYDFCDGSKDALDAICSYQAKHGITAFCPASMTLPENDLSEIFKTASKYDSKNGSLIVGINMEGPFFSKKKKGAQNPKYLKNPDYAMFSRLQDASNGLIKIVCLAPELEGSKEFIEEASKKAIVSLAHTNADYETAMDAFKNGASHITHVFNAMPPLSHRSPGVIGAGFDSKASVELICDGVHISPTVIRMAIKMFGSQNISLISDSMMATGLEDGNYSLGGQPVNVNGNLATLDDGTVAGSVTNLFDCMKKAVSFGIPLENCIQMSTENPAKVIGVWNKMGSVENGKLANFVLMSKNFNIHSVYIKGKPFFINS